MPKTIDLTRAARSAEAATFCTAVRVGDSGAIGAEDFTASGDGKRTTRLGAEGFTASGVGKEEE